MFIEGEEGSNGDMYVIMRMNYYECEECIVPAECPGIIFGFAATISVDAEPSCGAVMYSEGEVEGWNCVNVGDDFMCVRGFDENSDPIAITTSQYNQCVEILERAEESDRKAVMDGGDQQ